MTKTHKGHMIFISAGRAKARQWKSSVKIVWSEEGEGKVNVLTVDGPFRGREQAESAGFAHAKNWIDSGKPQSNEQRSSDFMISTGNTGDPRSLSTTANSPDNHAPDPSGSGQDPEL